jgi:hypothetical protein
MLLRTIAWSILLLGCLLSIPATAADKADDGWSVVSTSDGVTTSTRPRKGSSLLEWNAGASV